MTELVLLSLLSQQDMYGYEMSQELQTQLQRYRWRRIILTAILGLALGFGVFYCTHLVIDYIFYPSYVIIGEAQEDVGPMSTSRPIP